MHSFCSTFRDWAAEQTNDRREAAEMALAHVVSDSKEAAGDPRSWTGGDGRAAAELGTAYTAAKSVQWTDLRERSPGGRFVASDGGSVVQ